MPAQRINKKKVVYSHIYNRGVNKSIIFNDEEDYKVFLSYLKGYLTPPAKPGDVTKVFTVKGRSFKGIPHQPKNYFNKIDLIAYSLMPNHFHLLLQQTNDGSIEKFMRSLCTRYVMYFNKKHQRSGPLFSGPYKSVKIKDATPLLLLSRYLHYHPKAGAKGLNKDDYSSYPEFLGSRETSWVKSKVVITFFERSENVLFKGVSGYKNFVEQYVPNQKEKQLLEGITIEDQSEHLERSKAVDRPRHLEERDVKLAGNLVPRRRVPEFIATATVLFILLLAVGIRNINASASKSFVPSPTPLVSGVATAPPVVEETKPKIILVVKINDGSPVVNIRQQPITQSEKVGTAEDGKIFDDFVWVNSRWYEIKLADGSTAFISARYAQEEEVNN